MSKIIYIIFITILQIIHTDYMDEPPLSSKDDYPNIKCGKKNPKTPTDCTKYGTDSGMLCCWVTSGEHETNNAECTLLSYKMADLKGISGEKIYIGDYSKRYWNCGNNSVYLNINFILMFWGLLSFM